MDVFNEFDKNNDGSIGPNELHSVMQSLGQKLNQTETKDEKKVIVEYLDSRKDDSPAAIKQVVWALLTGPELRFNH